MELHLCFSCTFDGAEMDQSIGIFYCIQIEKFGIALNFIYGMGSIRFLAKTVAVRAGFSGFSRPVQADF